LLRCNFPGKQSSSSGPLDRDTASKPDGDGRPDSHVRGGSDGYRTVELPVEEERRDDLGSDVFELYHVGYDEF